MDSTQNINVEMQSQETVEQNITNESVSHTNKPNSVKTKGMFGGIFGAAAAAMGFKFASDKKDEEKKTEE